MLFSTSRRWLGLLALLLSVAPASASMAFVNRAAPNGATNASVSTLTTVATSHTTGNLVVCGINRQSGSAVSTVMDTAGNTYANRVSNFAVGSDTDRIDIWDAHNITGNASNVITVTLGTASVYASVTCSQFSGAGPGTSFGATATGSGSSTGAMATASVTTTGSDSVIYAVFKNDGATYTAGTGYTLTSFGVSGDALAYFADEYHLVSASEAASASQSGGSGFVWGAAAVSFNATSAAVTATSLTLLGVGR